MAKTVKGRRRKEYKHYNSGARRKLQKKERKKTSAYITMEDQGHFSKDFDRRRAFVTNYKLMGLCTDPNKAVTKPKSIKTKIYDHLKFDPSSLPTGEPKIVPKEGVTTAEKISETINKQREKIGKLKATKRGSFRYGGDDALFVAHLLDKYDKTDYKGMARDRRNYYQLEPKEIKSRITSFCEDPNTFIPYCRERGLLTSDKSTEDTEDNKVDSVAMNADASVEP